MIQEEKELLLKDLSARLSYGVKILYYKASYGATTLIERDIESFRKGFVNILIPYLRPMSSMTEEEKNEHFGRTMTIDIVQTSKEVIDWLNAHHFDYRGLIEKGLALEAPDDMYRKGKQQ